MSYNSMTLVLLLIKHLFFHVDSQFIEVLATSNARMDSRYWDLTTIFNAPMNGTLLGVRLVYISGSMKCSDESNSYSRWCCVDPRSRMDTRIWHVNNSDDRTGEVYYPLFGITQGWDNRILSSSDDCYADILEFISPSYEVTQYDEFSLLYDEVKVDFYLPNNNGATYADIYFRYSEPHTTLSVSTITTTNEAIQSNETITMTHLKEMYCSNLEQHIEMNYYISLSECINHCKIDNNCTMINYFKYFKTTTDSRCYMFDKLCDINLYTNNSVVVYKTFQSECNDYPNDWSDKINDQCSYYESLNWCKNGAPLSDIDVFNDLIDTKYGLTAIETCCVCGGGVKIIDNVVMSYDSDILCKWTESTVNVQSETQGIIREWDNFMLYKLCEDVADVNCEYLINKQFISNEYEYVLYICESYNKIESENFEFIFEIVIDDTDFIHNTYINMIWFRLDALYYSSYINIYTMNYSKCIIDLKHNNNINKTYHYGTYPCYILDTYSLSSTSDPNIPTIVSTYTINVNHDLFGNNTVYGILCVVLCSLMSVIIILLYSKRNKMSVFNAGATSKPEIVCTQKREVRSSAPISEQEQEKTYGKDSYCILCCDGIANMFNDPCGHVTYCNKCTINTLNNKCPSCREEVTFKQIYNAGFTLQ
eukprot:173586_1